MVTISNRSFILSFCFMLVYCGCKRIDRSEEIIDSKNLVTSRHFSLNHHFKNIPIIRTLDLVDGKSVILEAGDQFEVYKKADLLRNPELSFRHDLNEITYSGDKHTFPIFLYQNDSFKNIFIHDLYEYKGAKYFLFILNNNSLVQTKDNRFIGLLEKNVLPKNQKELAKVFSNSLLGIFELMGDTLELLSATRQNVVKYDDNRFVMIYPLIAQAKNSYFLGFNYLNKVVECNFKGKIIREIVLPSNIPFDYYQGEPLRELGPSDISISEQVATQVLLKYDVLNNKLIVITTQVNKPDGSLINKRYKDRDWIMSIFDLKKNNWQKHISFSKDYDYLSFIFLKNEFLVRKISLKQIVFDGFSY